MQRIKILINSFYKNTQARQHLMRSLRNNKNYTDFQFIICIGGYTELSEYKITKRKNVAFIKCPHNSIDFTGIITVIENQHDDLFNDGDYYFYIHDTCAAGGNFLSRVSDLDISNNPLSIPLLSRYSKNMGIYSNQLIMKHQKFVISPHLKNTDNNLALKYKREGVSREDHLFRRPKLNWSSCLCTREIMHERAVDYYKTGILRDVFYYPSVDLYKMQANNPRLIKNPRQNAILDL